MKRLLLIFLFCLPSLGVSGAKLITRDSVAVGVVSDTLQIVDIDPAMMSDSLAQLCSRFAVLEAKELKYDAGTVNYKREVKHTFEIRNIGSEPLIILSLRTGSSSMKAKISRKPLSPGERAVLKVEYEIEKMPLGNFMRNIELTTNSCGGSITVFTLSGYSSDGTN